MQNNMQDIMEYTQQNISFCIGEYLFNLKKNSDYYVIICNNTNTSDWLDAINMYSINKKPSKDKLIEKIKTKLNNLTINFNQSTVINEIETKEMKIYKELDRIKKLNSDCNNNINITGAKKLFNNSTIKDILENEYIKIWQNNSDKISIFAENNIYEWTIKFNHIKIGNILMKITFNQTYFPYAPPQICFISPTQGVFDHTILSISEELFPRLVTLLSSFPHLGFLFPSCISLSLCFVPLSLPVCLYLCSLSFSLLLKY